MRGVLARFVGLWVILGAVELLERVAYSAGVHAAAAEADDQADDDLAPADLSDVLDRHPCAGCCTPADDGAPRFAGIIPGDATVPPGNRRFR